MFNQDSIILSCDCIRFMNVINMAILIIIYHFHHMKNFHFIHLSFIIYKLFCVYRIHEFISCMSYLFFYLLKFHMHFSIWGYIYLEFKANYFQIFCSIYHLCLFLHILYFHLLLFFRVLDLSIIIN